MVTCFLKIIGSIRCSSERILPKYYYINQVEMSVYFAAVQDLFWVVGRYTLVKLSYTFCVPLFCIYIDNIAWDVLIFVSQNYKSCRYFNKSLSKLWSALHFLDITTCKFALPNSLRHIYFYDYGILLPFTTSPSQSAVFSFRRPTVLSNNICQFIV